MQFSPYIAARLHTYTEKGRSQLEMLIAKLGIPLQQAQSSYLREWGGDAGMGCVSRHAWRCVR